MLFVPFADAAEPELKRFQKTFPQMGVEFEVVLYAKDPAEGEAAIQAVETRVAELNTLLSDYDSESELNRLSARSPTQTPVLVSQSLWEVLEVAKQVELKSEGSFDVTVGPLTKLWRSSRRRKEPPSAESLKKAFASVGGEHLQLDTAQHGVRLGRANMRLDLGGIAKGYATDEGLRLLKQRGIEHALVRASGDISAAEPPPGESYWKVGIAPLDPRAPPIMFLGLRNQAVSTSGDSEQFLVVDGVRHSHLVDPKTGWGVTGRSSVTIVGPRGIWTDSLASAVSIQAGERGMQLIKQMPEYSAFVVSQEHPLDKTTTPKCYASPGFEKLLVEGKLPADVIFTP